MTLQVRNEHDEPKNKRQLADSLRPEIYSSGNCMGTNRESDKIVFIAHSLINYLVF